MMQDVAQGVWWVVALCWLYKLIEAWRGLPRVPNLHEARYDRMPEGMPSITVIVPARNEETDIEACLRSLLEQDYPALQIIAIDDRSTDATGSIMDRLSAESPERLRVIHVIDLPEGWLGKTHAMALAAGHATTDWLLFTDGDIFFRPDSVRRSLACAGQIGADHFITLPTTLIERWDEGMLLGFFQTFGMWAVRPWKVADPKAKRDVVGIGAFNMVRRTAYAQVGGYEALRMEVIEDIGLGRRLKRAGFAQRLVFGPGLVNVHWASGTWGLVEVMTKNIFSAFRFSVALALAGCAWLLVFCVLPFAGLCIEGLKVPAAVTLLSAWGVYGLYGRVSRIAAWNALLMPVAALLLLFTLLRSMVRTLRQGGIVWRGTFYPLAELRKHAGPLI